MTTVQHPTALQWLPAQLVLLVLVGCGGGSSAPPPPQPVYSVGGTVVGLHESGVVLASGTNSVTLAENATNFTLPTQLAVGTSYSVLVQAQPADVNCRVANGSGDVTADVSDIQVICVGAWAWINSTSTGLGQSPGIYGTLGVSAASNWPGGRTAAARAQDGEGNVWVFGGAGWDSIEYTAAMNDLWKYTPASGQWTWMSGPVIATASSNGSYGTLGVPAAGNLPGVRTGAALWADRLGHLWLFGGSGFDANGASGPLNDLWMFEPVSGLWAWMGGATTVSSPGTSGAQGVPAASNVPGARAYAATWTDANGDLWLFGGTPSALFAVDAGHSDLWKFSVASGQWTWMSGDPQHYSAGNYGVRGRAAAGNAPPGRVGASSWLDPQGHLWMFGGTYTIRIDPLPDTTCCSYELNDLWNYDPASGQWTWMSGSNTPDAVASYAVLGVESSQAVPGVRENAVSWAAPDGTLWLYGGGSAASQYLSDVWRYRPSSGQWTWVGGTSTPSLYGTYGTKGVPAADNLPPASAAGVGWVDSAGRFWLFGGAGLVLEPNSGGANGEIYRNDVWTYFP
jgi:hypothetical protein